MASVEVSLPMYGYWRPGRYIPVRIKTDIEALKADSTFGLSAQHNGSVPVTFPLSQGRNDVIIPLLMMHQSRLINWSAGDHGNGYIDDAFRPLGPNQRLVGFITPDLPFAQQLFPGEEIITIQLQTSNPLPGPTIAWELLDAVVLDVGAAPLSDQKLNELAACGIIIATRTAPAANTPWKWKATGGYHILEPRIMGPRAAADDLAAFAPIQGNEASWPAAFRRNIMLCAILFSILALGVGLLRLRHGALLLVLLCIAATGGFWLFWKNRPAIIIRAGVIVVRGDALSQRDIWIYESAVSHSTLRMPCSEIIHPYFESGLDRYVIKPVLHCAQDGTPQHFEFSLWPGRKIGFCMRSLTALPQSEIRPNSSSPLAHLARRMYLREKDRILGESDAFRFDLPKYSEQFATLIIEAQNKSR